MWLDVFNANPYGTNCWGCRPTRARRGGRRSWVLAGGGTRLLAAAGKTPVAVLATHAHLDHVGEAGDFAGETPVFIHEADAVAFTDEPAWRAGFPTAHTGEGAPTVADRDVLRLAGLEIEVMHTPGHTPGHCSFRIDTDAVLCSGDLVFEARSAARTSNSDRRDAGEPAPVPRAA